MKAKVGQFSNILTSLTILIIPTFCFLIFDQGQSDILIFILLLVAVYIGISFSFFATFLVEDDQLLISFFNPFKKGKRIKLSQIKYCKLTRNSIRGSSSVIQIYLIDNNVISISTITFKRELKKLAEIFKRKGIECELHIF